MFHDLAVDIEKVNAILIYGIFSAVETFQHVKRVFPE